MGVFGNKGAADKAAPAPTISHNSERSIALERLTLTEYSRGGEVDHYSLTVRSRTSSYGDSVTLAPDDVEDLEQIIRLIKEREDVRD